MARKRTTTFTVLNPSLALASEKLRAVWSSKGLSLEDMALEINEAAGEEVCNRDSLSRFLWAGTDVNKGLSRPAAFNKMLMFCADYFGVDRKEIKNAMDAEALRQKFLAELGLSQVKPRQLISALEARNDINKTHTKKLRLWLNGGTIDGDLYRLLPAAMAALEFVTGNEYDENTLIEWKALIPDPPDD